MLLWAMATMPGVRRTLAILSNVATAVSLIMGAAVVILWVRSYFISYSMNRRGTHQTTLFTAEVGRLGLTTIEFELSPGFSRRLATRPALPQWQFEAALTDPDAAREYKQAGFWGTLGFGSGGFTRPVGKQWPPPELMIVRTYWLPCWLPAIVFALWPATWLTRRLVRRGRGRTE